MSKAPPITADLSPCDFIELTVWVVVLESVVGECSECGEVVHGPIAPMFTHGWYCAACAAGLRGPTWAEVMALARNAAVAAGGPEVMGSVEQPVPAKRAVVEPALLEERLAQRRAKQRDKARARMDAKGRKVELTPERLASLSKAREALREWHEKRWAERDEAKTKALTDQ
jgi:hypothetical protein